MELYMNFKIGDEVYAVIRKNRWNNLRNNEIKVIKGCIKQIIINNDNSIEYVIEHGMQYFREWELAKITDGEKLASLINTVLR